MLSSGTERGAEVFQERVADAPVLGGGYGDPAAAGQVRSIVSRAVFSAVVIVSA